MQITEDKQPKGRRVSSQPDETKCKVGRPINKAVAAIMKKQDCSRATAFRNWNKRQKRRRTVRERIIAETAERQFCPIIKPSEVWNFSNILYPRIDPDETHGYIPGDLYCNALFHYGPGPGGLVVAPMAGSGMIHHVLLPEERAIWAKGRQLPLDDVDLRMSDLTPRGPYKALIKPWNILDGFLPVERSPDYVIADVPYLGLVKHQYSRRPDDIANMGEANWTEAMRHFARSCAQVGARHCTIVVTTFVNHAAAIEALCGEIVREAWSNAGYRLRRVCYADRHVQQNPRMKRWNNVAREMLLPISGMAEVLTFDLGAA